MGLYGREDAPKGSPTWFANRAKSARLRGARTLQIDIPLSVTVATEALFIPVGEITTEVADASNVIDRIEREGWRLENVGYVFRMRGSVSKERYIGGAERETVDGEIIGIYLFRSDEARREELKRATQRPDPVEHPGGRATFAVPPGPSEP